jgi:hypothetical protein
MWGLLFAVPAAAQTESASPGTAESAKDAPETLEDLFKQLDFFGAWAVDCARAASPANPHVSVTAPSEGLVLESHDIGADYAANQYSVLSAQRLPGDRLALEVLFQPGGANEQRQNLVLLLHGGTRRTLFNQPEGGEPRVKDGLVAGTRTKTPTLKKCG